MLNDLAPWIREKHQKAYYQPEKILDWLEEHSTCQHAVIVCSGDTGFYSGSGSMMRELKSRFGTAEAIPYEVKVYPGISSVSRWRPGLEFPGMMPVWPVPMGGTAMWQHC